MNTQISETARQKLIQFQRNEITEHHVYMAFSRKSRGANQRILEQIAGDELKHYRQFRDFTGVEVEPNRLKVLFYRLCAAVFGFTFGIKLMERGEKTAEEAYKHLSSDCPDIVRIIEEEYKHERSLIDLIDEDKLSYMGSMVLAVNNSIQEFSGIAAGLTFAMQGETRTIGITVLVSGLAATLAMSASEYLSQKADHASSDAPPVSPLKAVAYAGGIYLSVVLLIVLPYFAFTDRHLALGVAVGSVSIILAGFTFFMSVVKGLRYRTVLLESLCVAFIVVAASFLIGKLAQSIPHSA